YTVIEVSGKDRPSILHELAKTINHLDLNLFRAQVATFGERVVDVFYVKDIFGLQIHNEGRLQDIRQRLLQIFDSANEAAA
ncbi:MAG: hypothetical protein ACPHI1_05550, partial [Candidatus Puniceispirillaceae bacterium]